MITRNIGSAGRIVGIIIAVVLAALYFTNVLHGAVGISIVVLSMMMVLKSITAFCPLYLPFGLSTLHKKLNSKKLDT